MRKLALLTATAIAALALTATTAMASVEVRDASTEELCPPVSPAINTENPLIALYLPQTYESGGCTVQMSAEAGEWTAVGNGYANYNCEIDYDLHVGPDGWGYADNFNYSGWDCPGWQTTGSRTVVPGDVNPYGVFPVADSDTDFNTYWLAERPSVSQQAHGWISLDVTEYEDPETYPLQLDNQIQSGTFGGGQWQSETGLIVTRD